LLDISSFTSRYQGIYMLLDRGVIRHGSDYTHHIQLMAESAIKPKRATTVDAKMEPDGLEPWLDKSILATRPKTTGRREDLTTQSVDLQRIKKTLMDHLPPFHLDKSVPFSLMMSKDAASPQAGKLTVGMSRGLVFANHS
jgi:hypothetical protein